MNLQNISSIIIISIASILQCFAKPTTKIDIPFKNITVKIHYQYPNIDVKYSCPTLMDLEKFKAAHKRQRYFYDTEQVTQSSNIKDQPYGVDIQLVVKDPKTGTDIYLTKRNFNKLQGDTPISKYFQEHFMIQGKSAKINYTVDIRYGIFDNEIIEYVEINVINASVNGAEWPRNKSEKTLLSLR